MAVSCQRIFIVMPHSRRGMVEQLDFVTSIGHGTGGDSRRRMGIATAGPVKVITNLCILEPEPDSRELVVTSLHPGVTREAVSKATGWLLRFAADVGETPSPVPDRARRAANLARQDGGGTRRCLMRSHPSRAL